jgi:hypothetical protein
MVASSNGATFQSTEAQVGHSQQHDDCRRKSTKLACVKVAQSHSNAQHIHSVKITKIYIVAFPKGSYPQGAGP